MKKINRFKYPYFFLTLFLLSLNLLILVSCSPTSDLAVGVNAQEEEPTEEGTAQEGEGGEESNQETIVTSAPIGTTYVVVALANIPAGERLRADLLEVQQRPISNIAVRAGVTFSEIDLVVGKITKTPIGEGEAILAPMLALSSTDLSSTGSDLSLFVDNGKVAVAFPIDRFSGLGFAGRPGDLVDVFMSFNLIELDVEFQTALPNNISRVDETALTTGVIESGKPFIFPPRSSGRLESIGIIPNVIAQLSARPSGQVLIPTSTSTQYAEDENINRIDSIGNTRTGFTNRVTQLTIQQSEILWVGTWNNPNISVPSDAEKELLGPVSAPRGLTNRSDLAPDMVVLSLSLQDALILKWALEEPGVDIDLALRSQNDNAIYFTTSVSLPQMVEQAGLTIPEPALYGLQPRIDGSFIPRLPPLSPEDLFRLQQQQQQSEGGE